MNEKQRAHIKVYGAVKAGLLVRPDTCSKCGRMGKIQGHHKDYSKPLEVEWLCCKCHTQEHIGARTRNPPATTARNTVQRGLRVPIAMNEWLIKKVTQGKYRTPQEVILEAIREKQQAEQAVAA